MTSAAEGRGGFKMLTVADKGEGYGVREGALRKKYMLFQKIYTFSKNIHTFSKNIYIF